MGWATCGTGGTQRTIADAGVHIHTVEELTDFPEITDGWVKTLHLVVHDGILAQRYVP